MKPKALWMILLGVFLASPRFSIAADDAYVQSVAAFLNDKIDPDKSCIVIGLVDKDDSRVISWGKLGNDTDKDAAGDSVFLIGSVSKTFTSLLFQDMADHGELKLDDPASKYLPPTVKIPTRAGVPITLLDLATHTSGLPIDPNNMSGADGQEKYETYTVDKMYDYLSHYTLSRDPGTEFEYSNLGMGLLGHALALKAGTDFESLLVQRICRPLDMESTCVTLAPALKERLAMGHDASGLRAPPWILQAYAPAGGIFSTADDLLKYVSAQAGITSSQLTDAMEKTHVIRHEDSRGLPNTPGFGVFGQTAMDWVDRAALQPAGMQLLGHAGGAGSYHAFVGFDEKEHRGVVVLTTNNDVSAEAIGWTLLQHLPLTTESAKVFAHELIGIGTALDLDRPTHMVRITRVFPNSAAAQAGLSKGTLIQKIGDISMKGKSLADCVGLLRGNSGTKVALEVKDPNGSVHQVELVRRRFTATG